MTDLEQRVIKKGLCHSCGACAGICPNNAIEISTEHPAPKINYLKCVNCDRCLAVCSGWRMDFPKMEEEIFGKTGNTLTGFYKKAFLGKARDEKILKQASAGGIVSALTVFGLEEKLFDNALLVKMNEKKPWVAESFIAKNKRDVLSAAQSKYALVPVLKKLKRLNEKSIVVALPCQAQALRKAGFKGLIIGLYCGFNSGFEATTYLLKKLGAGLDNIKKLEYRAREWPGGFEVTLRNGEKKFVDKFSHNHLIPMFLPHRCKTCIDFNNDFADIAVGDAWLPELIKKADPHSLVLARTKKGLDFLKKAEKEKAIELKEIDKKTVLRAHRHTIKYKKVGGFARIEILRLFGFPVPFYGFENKTSTLRKFKEFLFLNATFIASLPTTRFFVSLLPLGVPAAVVKFVRRVWTRGQKK